MLPCQRWSAATAEVHLALLVISQLILLTRLSRREETIKDSKT